jgi:hypothetical protein
MSPTPEATAPRQHQMLPVSAQAPTQTSSTASNANPGRLGGGFLTRSPLPTTVGARTGVASV